jgi:hypothetical protein
VLTQCGFSGYQQNQPNEKRFSLNHHLTSKDLSCNRTGKRPTFQFSVPNREVVDGEGLHRRSRVVVILQAHDRQGVSCANLRSHSGQKP